MIYLIVIVWLLKLNGLPMLTIDKTTAQSANSNTKNGLVIKYIEMEALKQATKLLY